MNYVHVQRLPDKVLTAATVGSIAFGLTPPGFLLRLATMGALGAVTKFMSELSVEVDTNQINVIFGTGIFKKSISLKDVVSAKTIRTTPLQGWGIHWLGNGWLYNIYGLDAVEVRLLDGKSVYIGTDEPEDLSAAINQRLELFEKT
ncbi:MAG TPA: hypothetical protein V6C97_08110 [Oculatellaceae cyanobacterium]